MRFQQNNPHVQVAIIGSGFGGLGTAMQLKHHSIDDFVVFERGRGRRRVA
jgi:cation diffusion facilitator CzcD-associated flavoprotein CzcO